MSVRERLEDAMVLWEHGRREGAWIQVLIAAAATSRVRFPNKKDGEAFKAFIRQITPTIFDGSIPPLPRGPIVRFGTGGGKSIMLEEILYRLFRCNLLHEAELHPDVSFSDFRIVGDEVVSELGMGTPLKIPVVWVMNLAKAVAEALHGKKRGAA